MKNTTGSILNLNSIGNLLKVLPNPSKTLANKGDTVELYHAVASQPDIFSATQNYADAIADMDFIFADKFLQEYCSKTNILNTLVKYAVSARDYGIAIMEIVEYGDFNGKTMPLKLDLSPIEKFHFDTNRQLRLKSQSDPLGILVQEKFPNKFILIQNDATYTNPYGTALLDIAYWLAVGINGNFEFMLQFAEDDGRDKWVGKYQPGTSDEDKYKLLDMLYNLRNKGVAIMQEGSNIEAKDYKGRSSSTDLYKTINEMLIRKVEKLWYGTDLTMQVDGKGGYSSSQIGVKIQERAWSKGRNLALNAITQLVTIINNINSTTLLADCQASAKNDTTKEEAEIDQIYFSMGLKPTTEFFKKRGYEDTEFTLIEKPPVIAGTDPQPPTSQKGDPQNQQFSSSPPLEGLGEATGTFKNLEALFDHYKNPNP